MNQVALQKKVSDIVDEYNRKYQSIDENILTFESSIKQIEASSIVAGTYGESLGLKTVYRCQIEKSLLISAWRHVYEGLNIKAISSASDRKKFEQALSSNLPEFTLENIRATFGDYLLNPRQNILRGFAEVFCSLDPFYKSHSKVAIGVKGLPKRIIISGLNSFYGYGAEKLTDVINAIASYERKPLVSKWDEVRQLEKDGEALKDLYGIRLIKYKNGNGHLYFEPQTLKTINNALAEYYGEVLPDAPKQNVKKAESTQVSKDLQYYPTPKKVADELIADCYGIKGAKVLEPSCGCGRLLEAIRDAGGDAQGIEYDYNRVKQAREKGFFVIHSNFLETIPVAEYDYIIMNPPFYGKHYVKHVNHALKFLKKGGTLKSILPATARYDHKILKGNWSDLPVGSFSESGTNINTTILTIKNN